MAVNEGPGAGTLAMLEPPGGGDRVTSVPSCHAHPQAGPAAISPGLGLTLQGPVPGLNCG